MTLRRGVTWGVPIFFTLLCSGNSLGQFLNPRVTVFGGGSFVATDKVFVVDSDTFRSDFEKGGTVGLRGAVDLTDAVAGEASYSYSNNDLRITELEAPGRQRTFGVGLHQFTGNALYYFKTPEEALRPFVTIGLGWSRFSPSSEATALALARFIDDGARIESSNKLSFNWGGGLEARLTERIAVRVDVRDHIMGAPRFGLPETPAGPGGIFFPVSGALHDVEAAVGVVFYFQ